MSNTKRPANGHYSLAKYRKDAKGEPFVLDVDENTSITVPRPTGEVMMNIETAGSSRQIIRYLAGDQADALLEVLGAEDFGVMRQVADDMLEHFGLGESHG